LTLLVLIPLLSPWGGVLAWTGATLDGAEVRVDPETRRATRVEGDRAVPLWDGVHRMDDGSIVIIRRGEAVPNETMLRAWEGSGVPAAEAGGGPCEQLEALACGRDNACAASPSCFNARRLLNLERDEQRRAPIGAGPKPATDATGQCSAALADPALRPCADGRVATGPTPCQTLAERVCGSDQRCVGAPACAPAQQLLKQETAERATVTDPWGLTPSGGQCQEALGNDFFAPCP
jgi:hypothetical protein